MGTRNLNKIKNILKIELMKNTMTSTSTIQKEELHNKIWKIANQLCGSVDGWYFRHFTQVSLFYRYSSENFTGYITAPKCKRSY